MQSQREKAEAIFRQSRNVNQRGVMPSDNLDLKQDALRIPILLAVKQVKNSSLMQKQKSRRFVSKSLTVRVIRAINLPKSDKKALRRVLVAGDPYAAVLWNKKMKTNARNKTKTRAVKNNCNPIWDEDEVFQVLVADTPEAYEEMISYGVLEIRVLDDDGFFDKDDFLGHIRLGGEALRAALASKGEQTFSLVADNSRSSAHNKHINEHDEQAKLVVQFEVEELREYIPRKAVKPKLGPPVVSEIGVFALERRTT
jgi:hypothetical protein